MPNPWLQRTVILESSDGTSFTLTYPQETLASKLIHNAIEDEHHDQDEKHVNMKPVIISLTNVSSDILEQIVHFLKHYAIEPLQPIQPPLGTSFDSKITQDFYRTFVGDKTNEFLFRLVNAANYMDIPSLLDLMCLKVGFSLMGKTAEEIRVLLKIPKLTQEEEHRAREEHPWLFEE